MFWLALAIFGAGIAIKTIGNVMQTQAKAAEDERQAGLLEDLTKSGGYYDQTLAALRKDLKDIEADRSTAGQMYAMQSVVAAEQGAAAKGSVTASAGVGNLAQTGSVAVRKETIQRGVDRTLTQYRLQYEDAMRGLSVRQAQNIAEITKTKWDKGKATSDAEALRTEADWLNTWGVGLTIASGVTDIAAAATKAPSSGSKSASYESQVSYSDPYGSPTGPDLWGTYVPGASYAGY